MDDDVIIIGGSYAGLSAALQLARARRNVVIIDAGERRNRFTDTSHGLLSRDGHSGAEIAEEGLRQIQAYPTVRCVRASATQAKAAGDKFVVTIDTSERYSAQRLVLATGVTDHLPDIPGLAERWGKSVFHCPYCHGYELDEGHIGVIATSESSMHHGLMVPDWGKVTFFVNEAFDPEPNQLAQLQSRGALVERTPIVSIGGDQADVELSDGRRISLCALFTIPRTRLANAIAEQLGCAIEEGSAGPYIQTGSSKETSVSGVFACGDAARPSGSVALAIGDGALAGVAAHLSLVFE
ncbi:NAD(P)/FAD-dependent oxidoreductase [Candidimonas sp. SYP-B2681]|uniref:NAD(P)/FAD-dependent oxidoreductase n=1 Tax=Candidimonas sp. SYP-B2681 TaxID=2497686 RepID=UPI000F882E8B|nr:NAD(P)/FAD-dependent oxidoreductase [Candidimonas sp. SYP-B2681]RTZ41570.1 NAD(P)/FAD-dependent oxidoreductase [Candidimonas sp. SYP-B2681]